MGFKPRKNVNEPGNMTKDWQAVHLDPVTPCYEAKVIDTEAESAALQVEPFEIGA